MLQNRTIFIWDVQWCYDELKLLIKKLKLKKNDKVYFVWDLINKWPKSHKVLKYIYKNKYRFKSIKWNHELNFLKWIKWEKDIDQKNFRRLRNKIEKENEKYLITFLENLPLYIEEENFILLHWWLIPNKKIEEHTEEEITTLREFNWKPWYEFYKWEKTIIYWHWAEDSLQIRKNTKWLDSWCVYGKALTAYILETWEIIQQSSLNRYVNIYKNKNQNNIIKHIHNIIQKNLWN